MRRGCRIRDSLGVHARPAAQLVKTLALLPGPVLIEYQDRRVNGKSILEVMSLGIAGGELFAIECEESDAGALDEALAGLADMVSPA